MFYSSVGNFSWKRDRLPTLVFLGFPGGSDDKGSACHAGDLASVPGLGRSLGGGHGNPLQNSCLESPRDRGAWQTTVPSVLAWKIPWAEEPGRLQSIGSQRVRHY